MEPLVKVELHKPDFPNKVVEIVRWYPIFKTSTVTLDLAELHVITGKRKHLVSISFINSLKYHFKRNLNRLLKQGYLISSKEVDVLLIDWQKIVDSF